MSRLEYSILFVAARRDLPGRVHLAAARGLGVLGSRATEPGTLPQAPQTLKPPQRPLFRTPTWRTRVAKHRLSLHPFLANLKTRACCWRRAQTSTRPASFDRQLRSLHGLHSLYGQRHAKATWILCSSCWRPVPIRTGPKTAMETRRLCSPLGRAIWRQRGCCSRLVALMVST